jgi:2-oxoglutarate dehydrogenase complex dihydrolipoamide succinyltransferase (E2) component
MTKQVTMPKLGESVAEGTVGRWLKKEGDLVELDEPLVEIFTDKITTELPSPFAGRLVKIIAQPDQTLKVGAEIAQIEETSDVSSASPASAGEPATASVASVPATSTANASASVQAHAPRPLEANGQRQRISPLARRMAQEHQLDLDAIPGTGEGGRVRKEDILAFLAQREQAPAARPAPAPMPAAVPVTPTAPAAPYVPKEDEEVLPLTPIRRAIAEHMVRSKHISPHATTMVEVDMTSIAKWIERNKDEFKRREGASITYVAFMMRAAVEALKAVPTMNASWVNDQIVLKKRIHLGLAVSTDAGLMVPVVHNADSMNLAGLARAIGDLAGRARAGKLTMQDMQGATFTVNNPGVFGTIISVPIINQPHAGILSMDAVVKRPIVTEDEAIAIRSMMFVSLSFDHRINDGLGAARFLQIIKRHLESYSADISVY